MSGETLLQSWDGWDYYSGGTVVGPDGTYYSEGVPIWSPPSLESVASASAANGGGGDIVAGLFGLASKGLDVWAQRNTDGELYREGQARRTAGVPVSSSNMMLLLIGAGLLFVMAKA